MIKKVARGAALLLVLSAGAYAQSFPNRPVRLISPYPPGGGNDVLARLIAEKMGEGLGQRVIVDNRPGANTIVGTDIVAKSAPDGHTMVLVPNSFVTNVGFYSKLPYDTVRDFAPVALVALSPQMLVAHPSVAASNVKELVALAKAKPGYFSYGSSGNGSVGHLAMALFDMMAGVKMEHIAYKGTAPAVTELLGGQIPLMMSSMLSVLPHVKAGKLKLLALSTAKRSPALPDVPTVAESGVPGYEATLWYGLVAAAKTPPALIDRLSREVQTTLRDADIVDKLARQGVEPYYYGPQDFAARVRTEVPKWTKVIREAGIRAE